MKLHVASEPLGAEVYRAADGLRVGKTPVDYEAPRLRGEVVFLVKLKGYETAEVTLPSDED